MGESMNAQQLAMLLHDARVRLAFAQSRAVGSYTAVELDVLEWLLREGMRLGVDAENARWNQEQRHSKRPTGRPTRRRS